MSIDTVINGAVNSFENQNSSIRAQQLMRQANSSDNEQLKKVCEDFEAIFIKMMLDAMRSTLNEDGLISKKSGMKMFEEQLYSEYAQKMSNTAGFGIATMMYDQLSTGIPGSSIDLKS